MLKLPMLSTFKALNLGLRFLLELAMLAAFGIWGFSSGKSIWLSWLLGLGLPLATIALWSILLAPRSAQRLGSGWGQLLSVLLFALAATALYSSGRMWLALIFAVAIAVNAALALIWQQW